MIGILCYALKFMHDLTSGWLVQCAWSPCSGVRCCVGVHALLHARITRDLADGRLIAARAVRWAEHVAATSCRVGRAVAWFT